MPDVCAHTGNLDAVAVPEDFAPRSRRVDRHIRQGEHTRETLKLRVDSRVAPIHTGVRGPERALSRPLRVPEPPRLRHFDQTRS